MHTNTIDPTGDQYERYGDAVAPHSGYPAIHAHRAAAIEDSRLVCCTDLLG